MPTSIIEYHGEAKRFDPLRYRNRLRGAAMIGELDLRGDGVVNVSYTRGISEPFIVGRFSAAFDGAVWRRSSRAIREDNADFFYIRLVERGQLSATTSHGTCVAKAGSFSFTHSQVPYFAELLPDDSRSHEGFYALVPAYLLGAKIPTIMNFGLPIPAKEGVGLVARETLKILFSQGETLEPLVRASLAETFLSAIAQALDEVARTQTHPISGNRRLTEILRLIDIHAPNPELSANHVAALSGISRRYMSDLFKREGLNFTQVLQERRLKIAKDMLLSPAMSDQTVGEIAEMSGFGSSQYFCRIFKIKYKKSPLKFRKDEF